MYRLPADAFEPEFAELLRYWESKRQSGRLPARRDIDPLDLTPLLPHLLLFDVVRAEGTLRFRFRVAGTAFTTLVGQDVTGLYLDEIGPADRLATVISGLTAIAETGRPCFLAGRPTLHSDQVLMVKRLGLPLATDGRAVDMILAVWLVQPHRTSAAREPAEGGTPVMLAGD